MPPTRTGASAIAELEKRLEVLEREAAENRVLQAELISCQKALQESQATVAQLQAKIPPNGSYARTAQRGHQANPGKPVPAPPAKAQRRYETATRMFIPDSGPQGFEYVVIPRNHRLTRTEVRKSLRILGVDASRLLDVTFPSTSHVALLVHQQYSPKLKELMSLAKVPTEARFDLLDPSHLADPDLANLPLPDRAQKAAEIHRSRCLRATQHLAIRRPTVARAVARHFALEGWIADEDIPAPASLQTTTTPTW
ncbi:hypothetical protein H4R33_001891, partial [Dimargaris cristalligena]